jgi:hypothetical protein
MNRFQLRKLIREVVVEALSRREFLKRAAIGGFGVAAGAAGYGLGRLSVGDTLPAMPISEGGYIVESPILGKSWGTSGPIYHRGDRYMFTEYSSGRKINISDDGVKITRW